MRHIRVTDGLHLMVSLRGGRELWWGSLPPRTPNQSPIADSTKQTIGTQGLIFFFLILQTCLVIDSECLGHQPVNGDWPVGDHWFRGSNQGPYLDKRIISQKELPIPDIHISMVLAHNHPYLGLYNFHCSFTLRIGDYCWFFFLQIACELL